MLPYLIGKCCAQSPADVPSQDPPSSCSTNTRCIPAPEPSRIGRATRDWAKYIGWHLNESAGPVLKADATLRHLHEGVADRGAPRQKYGFGWIQFESSFGRTLQHAGSNTNQYALVWVMPDAERATLVVTNTGQQQAFTTCDAATAILMQSPAFR